MQNAMGARDIICLYFWNRNIMFIFLSWSWRGGESTVQQKEFGGKNGSNYFSCFPLKYNNMLANKWSCNCILRRRINRIRI